MVAMVKDTMGCQQEGGYYVQGRQRAITEIKTLRNRSRDALAYLKFCFLEVIQSCVLLSFATNAPSPLMH